MNSRTRDLLITVGLAMIVFVAVSVAAMVILGENNVGSQVSAHHGDTDDPPWVNSDGTMNKALMPDRLPVSDGNGGIFGYIEIDKDPNDDPEPGEPGFDEWNNSKTVYVSETGDEIAGTIRWDGPGDSRVFTPVSTDEEPPAPE